MAKKVEKSMNKLPLGAIRPQGWLNDQMQLMSNLQRRIGALSGFVKDGEWSGGESLPRYVRGLILLSSALDDKMLKEKIASFISPIFASANEGGDFGPKNTLSQTPKIEAVKALLTYYEATGNERVLPFLKKFFKNQFNTHTVSAMWFDSRARLLEEIEAIDAVYKETDLEWLHDLGEILRDASCDWFKIASRFPYKKPYNRYISQTALKHVQKVVLSGESVEKAAKRHKPFTPEYADKEWKKRAHQRAVTTSGVNIAKAIKYPVTYGRFIGDKDLSLISLKMIAALEKHYGTPLGAFSCSPRLATNKGVCAVDVESAVEMMESLVEVIRETRDYHAVDLLEKIAFNLVPGACFEDCSAVQDTVFVNQVEASASRKLPCSDAVSSFFTKKASRGAIAALSAYPIYMQAACMTRDWFYTVNDLMPLGHGPKSAMLIKNYIKLTSEEMYAIWWHMGFTDQHTDTMSLAAAIQKYPIVWALHTADMMASNFMEDKDGNKKGFEWQELGAENSSNSTGQCADNPALPSDSDEPVFMEAAPC